jgi:hypothetical protein
MYSPTLASPVTRLPGAAAVCSTIADNIRNAILVIGHGPIDSGAARVSEALSQSQIAIRDLQALLIDGNVAVREADGETIQIQLAMSNDVVLGIARHVGLCASNSFQRSSWDAYMVQRHVTMLSTQMKLFKLFSDALTQYVPPFAPAIKPPLPN